MQQILEDDFEWFARLYNISESGNWEDGHNHLHLTEPVAQFANRLQMNVADLETKHKKALAKLAIKRAERIRPGLDDKTLASWNGLVIKGLADAYRALGDDYIRDLAVSAGTFIAQKMMNKNQLMRSYKNGQASVTGFLEDYASIIEAYIALYQITFDETWINLAKNLTDYTLANFYDAEEGFFHFTDISGETLIARKKELFDNVVPASNSIMAQNLFLLGTMLDSEQYAGISDAMLSKMSKIMMTDVQWVTNWAALCCLRASPTAEVIFVGAQADELRKDFDRFFVPNKIVMGSTTRSALPLLENRTDIAGKTAIYVCYNKTCQLPVTSVELALGQLKASGA